MTTKNPLEGKNILLGISGGIAAYKCCELTRRLIEKGASVRIVMTKSAKEFITPLTMQALSGHPVSNDLLDPSAQLGMGHIELAKWADLVLLAPATANLIARISAGMADELLTTLCLASNAAIAVSPAMNQTMYLACATQHNISVLEARGMHIWGPAEGFQACGDIGPGRMLEVCDIVSNVIDLFSTKDQILTGLKITITAGPTMEPLDPVRYITNHSTGKMGYSLASQAQKMGADVTIISGPVNIKAPENSRVVAVETASQMHKASMEQLNDCDIFIACAAVADYKPAIFSDQKIKKDKNNDELVLKLVKNPDIIADVASAANRPFCVGFAAETQNIEINAKSKLERKNLDLVAANDVSKQDQGFNSEKNALSVFSDKKRFDITLASKKDVAFQLLQIISKQYNLKKRQSK